MILVLSRHLCNKVELRTSFFPVTVCHQYISLAIAVEIAKSVKSQARSAHAGMAAAMLDSRQEGHGKQTFAFTVPDRPRWIKVHADRKYEDFWYAISIPVSPGNQACRDPVLPE